MTTETLKKPQAPDHDEIVCHTKMPGTASNYCGAPLRPGRFHTEAQCLAAGHKRCRICLIADRKPQG